MFKQFFATRLSIFQPTVKDFCKPSRNMNPNPSQHVKILFLRSCACARNLRTKPITRRKNWYCRRKINESTHDNFNAWGLLRRFRSINVCKCITILICGEVDRPRAGRLIWEHRSDWQSTPALNQSLLKKFRQSWHFDRILVRGGGAEFLTGRWRVTN